MFTAMRINNEKKKEILAKNRLDIIQNSAKSFKFNLIYFVYSELDFSISILNSVL